MTTFIGILRQIKILVHGKIIDIIITMAEYSSKQSDRENKYICSIKSLPFFRIFAP